MTQSQEEIRTSHVSANQERKQLDCDLFGCFPGGRVPWQGSERTSPATDCHQAQAPTQAAPGKSSRHGATVIARDCGRRKITPAATSKKMSLDFSMSSTRCVSGGAACNFSDFEAYLFIVLPFCCENFSYSFTPLPYPFALL